MAVPMYSYFSRGDDQKGPAGRCVEGASARALFTRALLEALRYMEMAWGCLEMP